MRSTTLAAALIGAAAILLYNSGQMPPMQHIVAGICIAIAAYLFGIDARRFGKEN